MSFVRWFCTLIWNVIKINYLAFHSAKSKKKKYKLLWIHFNEITHQNKFTETMKSRPQQMEQEWKCEECHLTLNKENTLTIHIQNKLCQDTTYFKNLKVKLFLQKQVILRFKVQSVHTRLPHQSWRNIPFCTFKCTHCSKLVRGNINYKDHAREHF